MYQDVVRAVDINSIIDVGSVQAYIINQAKVVFLNARPQAKINADSNHTEAAETCRNCSRNLRDGFLYCCLACKVEAIDKGLDVATGSSDQPSLEPYIPGPTKFGSAVFRSKGAAPKANVPKKRDVSDINEPGSSSDPEHGSFAHEGGSGTHGKPPEDTGSDENKPPVKRPSMKAPKAAAKRPGGHNDVKKKAVQASIPPEAPAPLFNSPLFFNQELLNSFCPAFFPFPLINPSAAAAATLFNPMLMSSGLMFPSAASAFQPIQTFPIFSGAWSLPSDLSCLLAQPNNDKDSTEVNRDSNATSLLAMAAATKRADFMRGAATERSSGSSNSEEDACPVNLPHGHSSPLDSCGALKNKRKMGLPKRSAA